jgi:hypothetical protein
LHEDAAHCVSSWLTCATHHDDIPAKSALERWKEKLRSMVRANIVLVLTSRFGHGATDSPCLVGEHSCGSGGGSKVVARSVECKVSASLNHSSTCVDDVLLLSFVLVERGADVEDHQSIQAGQDRHDFRNGLRSTARW